MTDYSEIMHRGLMGALRGALAKIAGDGLSGEQGLYISFSTRYEGVRMPDYLQGQYPEEITIVLQHQLYELKVGEEHFSVCLSFRGKKETLRVPFRAVLEFVDSQTKAGGRVRGLVAIPPKEEAEKPAGDIVDLAAFRKQKGEE